MMAHVDLCSGIGGFALGFEWAGLSKPVLFCDIEPWSRKVLQKHWPHVAIAEDVKELANDPARLVPDCDILTAGYPCQPFSVAGKQRGTEDDRHIWPQIFQIIQAKRPTWIVCENVSGHISLGLDTVLSDLEDKAGYAVQTFCVGAVSVNAPHRRQRIWIIARNVGNSEYDGSSAATVIGKHDEASKWSKEGQNETQQFEGTSKSRNCQFAPDFYVADTDSSGLQGRAQTRKHEKNWAQPNDEQFERRSGTRKPDRQRPAFWKPEPNVGRMAHGIPRRVDRLKGLGNAIVPQIAMQIGLTIKAVRDE
tara:strand:- start:103 stop:1023 length:921 start_codon:yes stop_codon:yes gene_type:complete